MSFTQCDIIDSISEVELVDHMGNDTTVVNAARVSFGKRISEVQDSDKSLLCYLAKHKHMSPFRHVQFQFRVKAPEFVARQWYKHIVGAEYSFKDTAWNEISGRYTKVKEEFYVPRELRRQDPSNKQGSVAAPELNEHKQTFDEINRMLYSTYYNLLDSGVAKELARNVLPLSLYTEFYWTASLEAVYHFYKLRDHVGAQLEIRQYAKVLKKLAQVACPFTWDALESFV